MTATTITLNDIQEDKVCYCECCDEFVSYSDEDVNDHYDHVVIVDKKDVEERFMEAVAAEHARS